MICLFSFKTALEYRYLVYAIFKVNKCMYYLLRFCIFNILQSILEIINTNNFLINQLILPY